MNTIAKYMKRKNTIYLLVFQFLLTLSTAGQDNILMESHYGKGFNERIHTLNKNIAEKGIIYLEVENSFLLTGYSYYEFYDWDLYFENLYLSYYGISDYCFTNFKAFFDKQYINGFVPRTLIHIQTRLIHHFKPFMAQIAWLGSSQINDFSWLLEKDDRGFRKSLKNISYYDQLKLYLNYWFDYEDYDQNGLPVWMDSEHSGMDNQYARCGEIRFAKVEGVDLSCYIYRELIFISRIASKLGFHEDEKDFIKKASDIKIKINDIFWDEKDGFYYDRNERTGELVKIKSVAAFTVLWGGIADKEKADRLIKEHLLNPDEFWLNYPVSSYAKSEPTYIQAPWEGIGCNWRGPVWIPLNYIIFHGLLDYGFINEAKELAEKTFKLVYLENEVTREYYNAESGDGLGLNPFCGWSALGYFMPLEFKTAYDPTNPDTKIIDIVTELLKIDFPDKESLIKF